MTKMLALGYTPIGMLEVFQRYRELQPHGKWFSPLEMSYFDSTLPKVAYLVPDKRAYFVTSERYVNHARGDVRDRRYTVRRMNWQTGDIDNVGPFNELTKSQARKLAIQIADKDAKAKKR